jgi:xylulokinase
VNAQVLSPFVKGRSTNYALGIDLGTSAVKAGLLNLSTFKLDFVSIKQYGDAPEQDAETLWGRTVEAVKETTAWLNDRGFVQVVGLTGQMHGAVVYDSRGELLEPVITWKDWKWSGPETIRKMNAVLGGRNYPELGTEISVGYTAAILYGIRANAPELFARIAHVLLPVDFLRSKLLGRNSYATDPTNAFGTGVFDTQHSRWHTELIRELQLPVNILPEVHETAQVAGYISATVARMTGLHNGVPVIYGGGDNQVGMLGSGLSSPSSPLLVNIGTAAQVSKVCAQFIRYPGLATRSFFDGNFAIVGASLAGGESYAWLRSEIQQTEHTDIDYHSMDALAADVPPGADGLVFCPGPTRQALDRRRGFYGNVARAGDYAHRARAILEGVVMDLYDAYQILERIEQHDSIIGAGNSLQRSPVWAQVTADLLGKPLDITAFENAVFGAALLAAKGINEVADLDSGTRSIEFAVEIIPDPIITKIYREEFIPYWREVASEAG